MTLESKRFTAINSTYFQVDIEYGGNFVILHLPVVRKFNTSCFKEMKQLLSDWSEFLKQCGYEYIFVACPKTKPKLLRLLSLLSFEYIGSNEGHSIQRYKGK